MNKKSLIIALTGLFLLSFLVSSVQASSNLLEGIRDQDPQTLTNLVETTLPWPEDLLRAVSGKLFTRPEEILPGDDQGLMLTSLDYLDEGKLAVATVVMRPIPIPELYDSILDFPKALIVINTITKEIGIEGTNEYLIMVLSSPDEIFSKEFKEISVATDESSRAFPVELKWPWKYDQTWRVSGKPHSYSRSHPEYKTSSIDITPKNDPVPEEVVAAATGVVKYICSETKLPDQTIIFLDHGQGYSTGYAHLSKKSLPQNVAFGKTVQQGELLGTPFIYNGAWTGGGCGSGTGKHIHFSVGVHKIMNSANVIYGNIVGTVISGWTINSNGSVTKGTTTLAQGAGIKSDNIPTPKINLGQTINTSISKLGELGFFSFLGTANQTVTILMVKSNSSETLDPFLSLSRCDERTIIANDDDAAGSRDARIVTKLPSDSCYKITASSHNNAGTGSYLISLVAGASGYDSDDGRWLKPFKTEIGAIDPLGERDTYYFSGIKGRIISIRMTRTEASLDSYLELYSPNGSLLLKNDDGGGSRNAWIVVTLPSSGTYRVVARAHNNGSEGPYEIRYTTVDSVNYAKNKKATASSNYLSSPARAIDGSLSTYWAPGLASASSWLKIDLGQARQVDMVSLQWKDTRLKNYSISYWNGSSWRQVFWTNSGIGGSPIHKFGMVTTRYILVNISSPGLVAGLWEAGVYNSTAATVPLVPPEDPLKDPDLIEPLPPLPLPEEEAGKEILALYLGDGEDSQEIEATIIGDPEPLTETETGEFGLPVAFIEAISPGYPGHGVVVYKDEILTLEGLAEDTDFEGDRSILTYEWVSDIDGLIGTALTFDDPVNNLSYGEHVISFRAQDNEGNWSDWDQVTIEVVPYILFMPFVLR